MYVINTASPINMTLLIIATILLVFLGKELRKSLIPMITLCTYLVIIILHIIQFLTRWQYDELAIKAITQSLAEEFGLIALSFFAYLWIDDVEAKEKKKKSVDNSLDWFWKRL